MHEFCVSQGTAMTCVRHGGQVHNYLLKISSALGYNWRGREMASITSITIGISFILMN